MSDDYDCSICRRPGSDHEEMHAALDAAQARVAKLEARLEIDHCFDANMKRKKIPPEDRDKFPDGIYCRDATIDLVERINKDLQCQVQRLQRENVRLKEMLTENHIDYPVATPEPPRGIVNEKDT